MVQGGTPLTGGAVRSYGDHRIAMAAAVAASLCTGPVRLIGAEAVTKSYPRFWQDYQSLGGIWGGDLMSSSYGETIRFTLFGQSHGPVVPGVTMEEFPRVSLLIWRPCRPF